MGTTPPTRLLIRRIVTGVPQARLARAVSRSQAWVSRLELGQPGAVATVLDAERIAAVFGVPAEKLFATDGDPLRRAAA